MLKSSQISAIIFDCFGVIYTVASDEYYNKHEGLFNKDKSFLDELNRQIDLGEISGDEFYKRLEDKIGVPADSIREDTHNLTMLNQEMFALIEQLKSKYKIGLLSNAGDGEFYALERDGILDTFDAVIASYLLKIAKPDPRIYKKCADKLGVKPAECVFIDDNQINVEGAEKAGMIGIHYKNLEQLKAELGRILNA